MKKSRFTDEQMVAILREADTTSVPEAAKTHGVSEPTLYVWRKCFGRMDVDDTKRLKGLEAENARLKKVLSERDLEIEVMKEIAAINGERVRASARRRQVEYAHSRGLSYRRACRLLRVARSTLKYTSKKASAEAPVRARVREFAAQYSRYGYRRIRNTVETRIPPKAPKFFWKPSEDFYEPDMAPHAGLPPMFCTTGGASLF